MFGLSSSEILVFAGIAVMVIAAITALLCVIILSLMGRNLKDRLEQEYGKPWS